MQKLKKIIFLNHDYILFTKMYYLCKKFEKRYKGTNYF